MFLNPLLRLLLSLALCSFEDFLSFYNICRWHRCLSKGDAHILHAFNLFKNDCLYNICERLHVLTANLVILSHVLIWDALPKRLSYLTNFHCRATLVGDLTRNVSSWISSRGRFLSIISRTEHLLYYNEQPIQHLPQGYIVKPSGIWKMRSFIFIGEMIKNLQILFFFWLVI